MKIVVVGPVFPYRGGIAHYNSSLILALRQLGHDVKSISYSRQYPKIFYPGKSDKDPSLETLVIHSEMIIDSINPITWIKCAYSILKYTPDRVIFHWWTSFWIPLYLFILPYLKNKNINLVGIIHNVYPHENSIYDKWLVPIVLTKFDHFVVHSEKEFMKLKKIFPSKKISKYLHPVYDTLPKHEIDIDCAKQKLGINHNTNVLLMFGIIRKYKGLEILLNAIDLISKNKISAENLKLVVAGEFWEPKEKYVAQINELGISEYVIFHDRYIPNEEISDFFSAADLFIAPYTEGTQSGALNIALAWGLNCIISSSIYDEGLSDFSNIYKFEKGNADELGQIIIKLIKNENKEKNTVILPSWEHLAIICLS